MPNKDIITGKNNFPMIYLPEIPLNKRQEFIIHPPPKAKYLSNGRNKQPLPADVTRKVPIAIVIEYNWVLVKPPTTLSKSITVVEIRTISLSVMSGTTRISKNGCSTRYTRHLKYNDKLVKSERAKHV